MTPTTLSTATTAHYIRTNRVVDHIGYRDDYWFQVLIDPDNNQVYVQLAHSRPDADTGVAGIGHSGRAYLVPEMTDSEIVRKCLGLALAYEEHEVREFFTYKGARVFGPHISVDSLAEVADRLDVRS